MTKKISLLLVLLCIIAVMLPQIFGIMIESRYLSWVQGNQKNQIVSLMSYQRGWFHSTAVLQLGMSGDKALRLRQKITHGPFLCDKKKSHLGCHFLFALIQSRLAGHDIKAKTILSLDGHADTLIAGKHASFLGQKNSWLDLKGLQSEVLSTHSNVSLKGQAANIIYKSKEKFHQSLPIQVALNHVDFNLRAGHLHLSVGKAMGQSKQAHIGLNDMTVQLSWRDGHANGSIRLYSHLKSLSYAGLLLKNIQLRSTLSLPDAKRVVRAITEKKQRDIVSVLFAMLRHKKPEWQINAKAMSPFGPIVLQGKYTIVRNTYAPLGLSGIIIRSQGKMIVDLSKRLARQKVVRRWLMSAKVKHSHKPGRVQYVITLQHGMT